MIDFFKQLPKVQKIAQSGHTAHHLYPWTNVAFSLTLKGNAYDAGENKLDCFYNKYK